MIARLIIPLLLPVMMHAAVIRGAVVEHATGKPLARANVLVAPVAGTAGTSVSRRTDRLGSFEFQGLPGGFYMVTISRPGFIATEYGQKEWNSAGYPVFVEEVGAAFLQVRLRRLGAIAGTVLDDEDIGLPDHEVAVYRDTRPPELVNRIKADERGVYRFGGLMPGSYFVRTVGKHYDEGDYVPTFHREAREVMDAQAVEVRLDEQTENVNLKPRQGRLVSIEVAVVGGIGVPLMTLVSDTGRIEQRGRMFRFEHQPPGRYEIFAQLEPESLAGYALISADKDRNTATVQVVPAPAVGFTFVGAPSRGMQVSARRKDLAGTASPVSFAVGATSGLVTPGLWEFKATTPPDLYVASVQSSRLARDSRQRPDGWVELMVTDCCNGIRYTLSNKPAGISGVVTTGREPVAGAPVFLEARDPVERKRVLDLRETRTDLRGRYQFTGVAPGEYRILSTYEYRAPDSASLDAAGAKGIKMVEAQSLQLDLDLYVIR